VGLVQHRIDRGFARSIHAVILTSERRSVMLLQGAITNASQEISLDEFLAFLADEIPEAAFFKFKPESGRVYASAPHWRAVLVDAATVITIANGLCEAYDRFIKPMHENTSSSSAAIVVQIINHSGECAQFVIGADVKDKSAFISSFEASIKSLNLNSTSDAPSEELKDTQSCGKWIQVK
jgi:hypothetical protein